MLWLALTVMTLAAIAIVAYPMLRRARPDAAREIYSLEVYRDQLTELTADVERGVLTAEEERAARLEIERRMLALDDGAAVSPGTPSIAPGASLSVLAVVVVVIVAVPFGLYDWLGSPDIPDQPFAQRLKAAPPQGPGSIETAVATLAKRLESEPGNQRGWMLLGQSYTALRRYEEAADAFQKAAELAPDDAEALMALGESLVMTAEGTVIPAARKAFEAALALEPQHLGARFYLAEGFSQAGRDKDAFDIWLKLVGDSPADAPWMPALRERLERTAEKLDVDLAEVMPEPLPPTGPGEDQASEEPGPDAADLAAAQDMSAEDRSAMIRGMVDQLAERLRSEPDDFEGWMRLARSYGVLGEKSKAREALTEAARLKPKDVNVLMTLASAIVEESDRAAPLPAEAAALFARVLKIAPDNPDALYFTGLAAAQQKRFAVARIAWGRLIEVLEPGSAAHKAVQKQLDELPAE